MHDNFKSLIEKLLPDAHEREAFFACYHELLPKSIKIIQHKISTEVFKEYATTIDRKLTPPPFREDNDSWYIERKEGDMAL